MHAYSGDEQSRPRELGAMAVMAVVLAMLANAALGHITAMPGWIASAPSVAAAFGIVHLLVDRWLWRCRPFQKLGAVTVPVISGVYEGSLRNSLDQQDRPIRLEIEQTWTRLSVRLELPNVQTSTSSSISARLVRAGGQRAILEYNYENTIAPGHAEADMHDHRGSACLDFDLKSGTVIGTYYNSRGRQGSMRVSRQADA